MFTGAMNNVKYFGGDLTLTDYNNGNANGIYSNKYLIENRNTFCYFISEKYKRCPSPPPSTGFKPISINNMRLSNRRMNTLMASAPTAITTIVNPNETPARDTGTTTNNTSIISPPLLSDIFAAEIAQRTWFHNATAYKLFLPKVQWGDRNKYTPLETEELVLKTIKLRIKVCEHSMEEYNNGDEDKLKAWYLVVDGADENTDIDEISEIQRIRIRRMCQYIMIALKVALVEMRDGKNKVTWMDCCQVAVDRMKDVGCNRISSAETVQIWHMKLREGGNTFPHPNPRKAAGQISEPLFMSENPNAKNGFIAFADELAAKGELRGQVMTEYVNDVLVKNALEEQQNAQGPDDPPINRRDFLLSFELLKGRPAATVVDEDDEATIPMPTNDNISEATVIRWMNLFGFKYDVARKHFYNDTHEDPMTIRDRWRFILRYLFRYEPRAFRWIQVTKVISDEMKQKGTLRLVPC